MKALLVVDMLNDFIYENGVLYTGKAGEEIVDFIREKIVSFREEKDSVIFICDNHEIDDKEFDMFPPHCLANTEGSKIIKELEVKKEDKIIKKRRYSAFFGTDLDLYLREKGIDELYVVGVCTNICILYTCADARNLGYKVNIYKDGVASFDLDAHNFALREAEKTLGCKILTCTKGVC
ncbi:MAG: cysteine hydrolase [Sporanaerobacter sp.]|jgi:nicotinamidase/pyrazinamidase|uniref:cysteine hydrolase family protein n=1 Tax=Sporanaerobacter sp. TaxID=2010183 RepID=UPI003A100247